MQLVKTWNIPLEVVSEANVKEHWVNSHKRHKNQHRMIKWFMSDISLYSDVPIVIKLTRLSSRKLDEHDNLPISFKYVVDAIADLINPGKKAGRADDSEFIEWKYSQEKGQKGIRIELYKKEDE